MVEFLSGNWRYLSLAQHFTKCKNDLTLYLNEYARVVFTSLL